MYTPPRSLAEAQQQQCHHCPWCSGMLGAWRRRRKRARRVLGWRLLLAIAMVAVMWMMLSLFAALSCINIVCVCVCVGTSRRPCVARRTCTCLRPALPTMTRYVVRHHQHPFRSIHATLQKLADTFNAILGDRRSSLPHTRKQQRCAYRWCSRARGTARGLA